MGSHLCDDLLASGYKVIALDDLSGGFAENVPQDATFVHGSVTDVELVEKLFKENKIDYIFHLAAYAAEGLSHFIKRFNYTNNLLGSINLINAAINHNIKCFVFTSSIAVYGSNQVPMTEDLTPMPEDSYGIAKYAFEMDLKVSHEMFGLNYIVFRPHNVYGERQNIGDKYRNVIGIFMNQMMQDKPVTVFGDGEQTRAFSYIGDVSPIIARSIETPEAYNQIFNVGADTPYTVNYLAEVVAKAMNKPVRKVHLDARNEVVNAYASHDKIRSVFGAEIKFSLEEGVKRQAEWAMRVGSKASEKFENIEIMKNLPPSWRS
jgi:UDP-glucose 4-epimerase